MLCVERNANCGKEVMPTHNHTLLVYTNHEYWPTSPTSIIIHIPFKASYCIFTNTQIIKATGNSSIFLYKTKWLILNSEELSHLLVNSYSAIVAPTHLKYIFYEAGFWDKITT